MTDAKAALQIATRLTRSGALTKATEVLQRMLGPSMPVQGGGAAGQVPPTIDGVAEPAPVSPSRFARHSAGAAVTPQAGSAPSPLPNVPEAMRGFMQSIRRNGLQAPSAATARAVQTPPSVPVPEGARFLNATFRNQAGSRAYKLYVPSGYRGQPVGLIVMLHGCTQSPDDFAAGTRMNAAAEECSWLVAYPEQTDGANAQRCWNWFRAGDQQRDAGEPSLIAGITRAIMRDYAIDPRRVYVAGLSAGGAAAAVMGDAYPDLYAAIGVHSGLACGAARDMPSAFAAMQRGGDGSVRRADEASRAGAPRKIVPAIVFHGSRDATVNPRNARAVVAQSAQGATLTAVTLDGQDPGGHPYSRTQLSHADGQTLIEQWEVHGAGHVWFGGSPSGSYTDARGPDATAEMLRFFQEHPLAVA